MYEDVYSETFKEKVTSTIFCQIARKIENKCNIIRQAPYQGCRSERLKGNYLGKRSGQLDERFRIIYMVCEECIKQGDQKYNIKDCHDCEGIPLKRIKFIDITDYH